MSMQVASVMGAHDFSHMICTSSPSAPALCAKVATAEPCTSDNYKHCLHSIICPEPSNPEIVCRAQKWYGAPKGGSHMTKFPSADKWEPLMGNRYGLTQRKALESVWEYFKAYRNDFHSLEATWGTKSNDIVMKAGGFHLPVCFKEGLDVTNDLFPVSCGDWRSSETEIFMAASFMGPNGQLFNTDDDFVTRVLPDVADKVSKTPLARYLNLCAMNIRWPTTADKDVMNAFKIHRGPDPECGVISASTQSMSEEAANEWFCTEGFAGGAHSVFKREWEHAAITPVKFRYSHRVKCKAYMKKQGGFGDRLAKGLKNNGTMPVEGQSNVTAPVEVGAEGGDVVGEDVVEEDVVEGAGELQATAQES